MKTSVLVLLALALGPGLGGCTLFVPPGPPPPGTFALTAFTLAAGTDSAEPRGVAGPATEIEIASPVARPGFEGPRMAYVTRPYEIQYFTRHQWVEPPARMLAPLLGEALEREGRFRALSNGGGTLASAGALRLETEIVALQQEFSVRPSQVRFALRARLLGGPELRVLAASAFEALEPSPSEDPYGGVVAANRAVARVLDELAAWCAGVGGGG